MEALTATVPTALDAVILQGFSANTSFVAECEFVKRSLDTPNETDL